MDKRTGNRMLRTDGISVMVSFRCKKDLKKKIETKARHMGIGESRFISDCLEMGVKRRSKYDKGKVKSLVEMQEAMNHMVTELGAGQGEQKRQVLELMERSANLWEF